uniref:Uncharacterized protein n=1 Tax=viral metagenome TaxID=1070528 RepID=A0A2V0RBQ5_9ZZZZ
MTLVTPEVQKFYLLPKASGKICLACKKGEIFHHVGMDVDDHGRLIECTVARTLTGRTIGTVFHSSCSNTRCDYHLSVRKRRQDDANALFRILQDVRQRGKWRSGRGSRRSR